MQIEINSYSLLMAFFMTLFGLLYTIVGYAIIKDGQVALYTFFLMTGGMLVPYVYGIFFLEEDKSLLRTIGLAVIVLSVFITNSSGGKKLGIKSVLMCVAVFLFNGLVSVVSKLHQINPVAVTSEAFVMLTGVMKFVGCLIILAVIKLMKKKEIQNKTKPVSTGSMLWILAGAAISGVSYLLQLKGAISLPATVLYPIITGGSIIFTGIAGWIVLKEKPDIKLIIGMLICFIGTCMFL